MEQCNHGGVKKWCPVCKSMPTPKRKRAKQSVESKGNLMAKVFLRNTGAINDYKGNYVINEKDLFAWFENSDYLKSYTEYDIL